MHAPPSYMLVLLGLLACSPQSEEPDGPTPRFTPTEEDLATEAWLEARFPPPAPLHHCGPATVAIIGTTSYFDLQDALDASVPQDTITVCPGTWSGGFEISGPGPRFITGATGNPADVVLDGGGVGPVLLVTALDVALAVRGLRFQDGDAGMVGMNGGGAIWMNSAAPDTLVVDRCEFDGNRAPGGGGAIVLTRSTSISISRSEFRNGWVGDSGGAIFLSHAHGDVYIRDSVFENNTAFMYGGAIHIGWSGDHAGTGSHELAITRTTFRDNSATLEGGAVRLSQPFRPTQIGILDSLFHRNAVDPTCIFCLSTQTTGGAINIYGARDWPLQVRIAGSTFAENAGSQGAGIYLAGASAATVDNDLVVSNSSFFRNRSPGWYATAPDEGKALWLEDETWRALLHNVNFGVGVNDNPEGDIAYCPLNYGSRTNGAVGGLYDRCP